MPYTCYATGIAWRTDKIKEDIASMEQPWDIFWESQAYKGKVGLLSEGARDDRHGAPAEDLDINTEDPAP